jgi:hypothetical protein
LIRGEQNPPQPPLIRGEKRGHFVEKLISMIFRVYLRYNKSGDFKQHQAFNRLILSIPVQFTGIRRYACLTKCATG